MEFRRVGRTRETSGAGARASIPFPFAILVAVIAFAALGCRSVAGNAPDAGTGDNDSDVDSDTDTDSDSVTDSDSEIDIWDWTCTTTLEATCEDYENNMPETYSLAFSAADFGLTFVRASLSPALILAERETEAGIEPRVFFWNAWTEQFAEAGIVDPPPEPLRAVDIATPRYQTWEPSGTYPSDSVLGYAAVALLCGETACYLYQPGSDPDGGLGGLFPVPGGEVPLAEPRAITWFPEVNDIECYIAEHLCVAGDGVACFWGDGWTDDLAPGGGAFEAIDLELDADGEPFGLWAAGAGGRVATNRSGGWEEIDSGTTMDLLAISAHDGIWAAGGDGGFVFGDGEHATGCEIEGIFSAMFVHEAGGGAVTALAGDYLFEIRGSASGFESCAGPPDFAGSPRNADYLAGCSDVVCGYALTTEALYTRVEYGVFPG